MALILRREEAYWNEEKLEPEKQPMQAIVGSGMYLPPIHNQLDNIRRFPMNDCYVPLQQA